MHRLSFEFGDRFSEVGGFKLAFRVYTLYNVYGPLTEPRWLGGRLVLEASEYTWAGGQKRVKGRFRAEISEVPAGIEVSVEAEHHEPIKAVAVILSDLEDGLILDSDWTFRELGEAVAVYSYPWPWLSESKYIPAPFYLIKHGDGSYTYAVSMDREVRPKRFRVVREGRALRLFLVHEEDARRVGRRIEVPPWRIGRTRDPKEVVDTRVRLMEREWGLKRWEERDDVPEWARNVCLVLNIHFKHWTGYVFNTYESALRAVRWVCERIPGRHVLAFLAGWDGRYYYDYPSLEPDPDMGGDEGFRELVEGIHELGAHVVPMTCPVAVGFTHAKRLGFEEAVVVDKYGNRLYENWVDWDGDGERDNIWYPVNVGHPAVRRYLLERIRRLVNRYGVDGIFFDISFFYENDPRYSVFEGLTSLIRELHQAYPGRLLVMGECWYDALLPYIPLTHAHTMLPKNWNYFYLKYARMAYHLSWPAPGGSTGVHEMGYGEFRVPSPDEEVIPTLTIVDDTIPGHSREAEEVIRAAIEWGRRRGIRVGGGRA